MRILLICPFFPPENKISAVRVAKFAENWAEAGHEVRVLTRETPATGLAEPHHSNISIHRAQDPFARLAPTAPARLAKRRRLFAIARALYSRALSLVWPDLFRSWGKAAQSLAMDDTWRPDVVVASGGPFTALRVGSKLAKNFDVPFVIDYRDLLATSTYYQFGALRHRLDMAVENRIARQASLLATVSDPLAEELKISYDRPTVVVLNGYDPNDFKNLRYEPKPGPLRIVHCGWVRPDRRDPGPFLRGVHQLLQESPELEIEVDFYGPPPGTVLRLISELNLERVVSYRGQVNHATSLALQAEADALLLLLWNDPGERGVFSGKVFEYVGADRPIIMTGYESSVAAELISQNDLGIVTNDSQRIASYLRELANEKLTTGKVAGPGFPEANEYTRDVQSQHFLNAIESAISPERHSSAG
ncbi:glycosyltransferase family 4 protein [Leucobacter insecticola]|uniref:Glycosyltransferase family 4 protein n=1 Tax=Leucobacter insecticola TaxID=2714934 RepID=A0A6G8FHC8_9MICO|nr:glycosyltransferase [Leucobacter insecticola]QIM15870.1 glycosyltransferase family 4 protein [Leucobacter insecticola]